MWVLVAVIAGCALDLIFGDPQWMPHPVRLIGQMIGGGEKLLRKFCKSHKGEYVCGMVLSVFVAALAFSLPCMILSLLCKIDMVLAASIHAVMCFQVMAAKSLKTESMKVYSELKGGNLVKARNELDRAFPGRAKCLSMGMSGDYETAIEEGATLLRIGAAIFGDRT